MSVANKIIFLDVDGVLNAESTFKGPWLHGATTLDPEMCDEFARIIKETDAIVVLSSTWRLFQESIDRVREWLIGRQVVIHSVTPDLCSKYDTVCCRGHEIDRWLEKHPEFDNPRILILDDDTDMNEWQLPFFVQTDFQSGLTKELADKAIEILNDENK